MNLSQIIVLITIISNMHVFIEIIQKYVDIHVQEKN